MWKSKLYSRQDWRTVECTRVVTRVKTLPVKKEELQTPISGDFQLKMYLSPTPGKNQLVMALLLSSAKIS